MPRWRAQMHHPIAGRLPDRSCDGPSPLRTHHGSKRPPGSRPRTIGLGGVEWWEGVRTRPLSQQARRNAPFTTDEPVCVHVFGDRSEEGVETRRSDGSEGWAAPYIDRIPPISIDWICWGPVRWARCGRVRVKGMGERSQPVARGPSPLAPPTPPSNRAGVIAALTRHSRRLLGQTPRIRPHTSKRNRAMCALDRPIISFACRASFTFDCFILLQPDRPRSTPHIYLAG